MKIKRLALLKTAFLLTVFLLPALLFAQQELKPAMDWLTFDQVRTLYKENPKPIMVFFYKAGNDSSQLMLKKAFDQKEVCLYTSAKFYSVKFDINSKTDVTFMDGKVYKKNPNKPYHDLVTLLLGNKPKAPTVLLYDDQNKGFPFVGYKDYPELLCMLVYISENVDKTSKYETWRPAYFRTFPPNSRASQIPLAVKWLSLKEALTQNTANPKGIFVTFYAKNNASSSVMLANAFSHKTVAEYLNKNFYCVRLDAQTSDTLVWDKQYINKHESGNYHELAKKMMKDKMEFPSIFYFDATNRLILNENSYLSPEALYLLSNYVVSESYKTKAFADFIKTFKFEFNDIVPREHENAEPVEKSTK